MNLPFYLYFLAGISALLTLFFFYKASHYSKPAVAILLGWLVLQGLISSTGFYTVTATMPPRLMLAVIPPLLFTAALFLTTNGKQFIDSLNAKTLTLLHLVRVPVELMLLGLFLHKTIPQAMTFEGSNFDILSGLSAPLIYYFGYIKKRLSRSFLLLWNFACLALLITIVGIAIAAAPFPFQQIAFDQPNRAVLHFPFVWLPCFIVPLVLFAHLAAIRQLLGYKRSEKRMAIQRPVVADAPPLEAKSALPLGATKHTL